MDIIKTGLKLFIISLVAAASLAAIYDVTAPVIEENQRLAREAAMTEVLGGINDPVFSEEHQTGERTGVMSYYSAVGDGGSGYVLNVRRMGDQGFMNFAVGLSQEGVVLGVRIVSHSETPGLGTNAARPEFLSQFEGKTGPFSVVRSVATTPNDIVAVTAATNTSVAVADAVNDALDFFGDNLQGGAR